MSRFDHLRIILNAVEPELATAWENHYGDLPGVSVHRGSILDVACDAVVSPANSFGFMDGGIDPEFKAFATAGQKLAEIHLKYEELDPYLLEFVEAPGVPLSFVVTDKMKLSKDKTTLRVNDSLTAVAQASYRFGESRVSS